MSKLLLLVVSVIALVAIAAGFQQKQLRCSDTNSYSSAASNFQLVCKDNIPSYDKNVPLTDSWLEKMKKPFQMLDFIEHCTCSLLSMTMIWETMLTHEIEIMYAVSRDFVGEFDKQVESALAKQIQKNKDRELKNLQPVSELMTVRRDNPLFAGDDGDALYHYYVLNYIVSRAQTTTEKAKFFERIMKRTSLIYFDLKHLESSYKSTNDFPMDHTFTLLMSGACKNLQNSFGTYLDAISMMREGFENEMWIYRVVSHDETLFKLVISSMLCTIVIEQVEIREKALAAARG